jgi:phospholipid/cholesterol/gamma-HCH transport system substrate-binding protein
MKSLGIRIYELRRTRMETRANYTRIGAFICLVLAALCSFVFWSSGASMRTARAGYTIVFTGSVSGLSVGSKVSFNGLSVGEVTKLELVPNDPSKVMVSIGIAERVPMRQDTIARLEYSGLTGTASIALAGGSATSPALPPGSDGKPALIEGDSSGLANLIDAGKAIAERTDMVLEKLDQGVDANVGSITAILQNAETASQALADNADGVGGFFAAISETGSSMKPMAERLASLATETDLLVKAIDPAQVKAIVAEVAQASARLDSASGKIEPALGYMNQLSGAEGGQTIAARVSRSAKSMRTTADDLNVHVTQITASALRFTEGSLRHYEMFAKTSRQAVQDLTRAFNSATGSPQAKQPETE